MLQSKPLTDIYTKVIPVYILSLLSYSLIVSWYTSYPWYTMIAYYGLFMLCFYVWHYQAHHRIPYVPFNKECHKYHHIHHWVTYPSHQFFGQTNVPTSNSCLPLTSTFQHEALVYLMFSIIIFISRLYDVSYSILFAITIMALSIGIIGNYLHMSFHDKNQYLSKYVWWQDLQYLHYLHHTDKAKHNYAMVNFLLDIIFGSFKQ